MGRKNFDPGCRRRSGLRRSAQPYQKHCWVKDTWRSMSYVMRDVAVVFGLAAAAAHINSRVCGRCWVAQGTMFWAFTVLGHDWHDDAHLRLLIRCYSFCEVLLD
ncbi:hypothetical protein HPP92_013338 [Vanilla planifolia]|uniref:Fatty acid desaturase N-terminal domain-containing protein n=1 Tax=Vanilla planifolia TaxID=51239 RepID=A0A835QYF3_VANPL|nr:hypothetical protein HPP92_013338 [Vanilla planifolia]